MHKLRIILFVFLSCNIIVFSFAENYYILWKQADELFESKKYKEALELYLKIDKEYNGLNPVEINIARCYYSLGTYSKATIQFAKIVNLPNINREVYKEYAISLEKKEQAGEASKWWEKYHQSNKIIKEELVSDSKPFKESTQLATTNKKKDTLTVSKPSTPKKDSSIVLKNNPTKNPIQPVTTNKKKDTLTVSKPSTPKKDTITVLKNKPTKESIQPVTTNKKKDTLTVSKPSTLKKDTITVLKNKPTKESIQPVTTNKKIDTLTVSKPLTLKKDTITVLKNKPTKESIQPVTTNKKKDTLTVSKPSTPKTSPEIKKSIKKKGTTTQNYVGTLSYKIKIGTYLKDPGIRFFYDISALGRINSIVIGGYTTYYLYSYKSYNEAQKYLAKVKQFEEYQEATIIATLNDTEISVEEAQKLEQP